MSYSPKFCFVCGAKLALLWPGGGPDEAGIWHEGDPESGPREWSCSQNRDHPSFQQILDDEVLAASSKTIDRFLDETKHRIRHDPDELQVPEWAKRAAEVLEAFRHLDEVEVGRFYYHFREDCWAAGHGSADPMFGPTRRQMWDHLIRKPHTKTV